MFRFRCCALTMRLVNLSLFSPRAIFSNVSRPVVSQWSVESLTPVNTAVAFNRLRTPSRDLGSSDHHSCMSSLYIPVILECKDAITVSLTEKDKDGTKEGKTMSNLSGIRKINTHAFRYICHRLFCSNSCPSK